MSSFRTLFSRSTKLVTSSNCCATCEWNFQRGQRHWSSSWIELSEGRFPILRRSIAEAAIPLTPLGPNSSQSPSGGDGFRVPNQSSEQRGLSTGKRGCLELDP